LAFAYIGALLKKHGHDVQVFDRQAAMARLGPDQKRIDQAMLAAVKTFARMSSA
jgi:2-polyprenyl-6-methoxyphenol hydroxylase-like FAD-dependent oxidoreductase